MRFNDLGPWRFYIRRSKFLWRSDSVKSPRTNIMKTHAEGFRRLTFLSSTERRQKRLLTNWLLHSGKSRIKLLVAELILSTLKFLRPILVITHPLSSYLCGTGYQFGIGSVTVTRITQNCNTTFDSFLSFDKLVLSLTRRLVVTYFSFISFFNQVVLSRTPNNGI